MKRENRYLVLKRTDMAAALSEREINRLNQLGAKVAGGRRKARKKPFMCVVVESDWPEYEPTWKAIEDRVAEESTTSENVEALEKALGGVGIQEMQGERCVYFWDDCRGQGSGLDVKVRRATASDEAIFKRLEKARASRR